MSQSVTMDKIIDDHMSGTLEESVVFARLAIRPWGDFSGSWSRISTRRPYLGRRSPS